MSLDRRTLLNATVLAMAPSLVSRLSRAQSSTRTLRFGLSGFPPNLRPWVNTGVSAGTVKLALHRGLLSYDSKGDFKGELAVSWTSDGEEAWVFKLRENAFFHNGDPVEAEDVKWTIEQMADEKSGSYLQPQLKLITSVDISEPRTVRISTNGPQPTLPSWFANYNAFIVSRQSPPGKFVGAGPYRLVEQERGTFLTVEAFDKYYRQGLPKLKAIRFIVYSDENLRTAALKSGDVDIVEYVPAQAMDSIEADPQLRNEAVTGPFLEILFNGSKPPFADPRVRRAVAHSIRREEIVKAAFFGRGKPLEGLPIAEGTPFFNEALSRGWNYDPARAKALLVEAGYANGFQTSLLATAQYGFHKDSAEIVQQHLAEVGIQCELRLPDWATRVSLGNHGQYNLAIQGVAADSNDPDGLTPLIDTSLPASFVRSFGLSAPRTSAALTKGRTEFDQTKRVQIYLEMQTEALDEVPMVGLTWRSQGYGMKRSVKGFTNLPGALTITSGVTLDETYFA